MIQESRFLIEMADTVQEKIVQCQKAGNLPQPYPSLPTHTQNPKQIMRKTQNNLLNRYQGLLQGALTTLKYNKYQ